LDPMDVEPVNQAIHDLIGVVQRSQALQECDRSGNRILQGLAIPAITVIRWLRYGGGVDAKYG